jgi:hypothetical protein
MLSSKFNRYLERRDKEARKRDAEIAEEARKRDEEAHRRSEEGNARRAELQRLREKAEAQEEGTREFNREILLRNEKVYTTVIAEMERNSRRIDEGTKQLRANTQAVLSVLDRHKGSSS